MVRKGQRTGIFDLDNVDAIKLNLIKQQKEETVVIGVPQILVEPTEIKRNGKIPISNAILIIQEQLKITGIRKVTASEYIYTSLIQQNNIIRKQYKKRNKLIFIGKFGDTLDIGIRPSSITKRLSYYSKKYGLTDINAHAIRRLYAINLSKKGAFIPFNTETTSNSD